MINCIQIREPKEKPDSLVPDKPSFLGGDTKVGEKAEQTHDRVGEFIDDNEGNIPEEYVDKLKDLQKRAEDIGLSIFNNDGRAPEGTTNKIKELDAEAQEMMDDIEQKAMDGEFDKSIKESKQRRYTVKEVRMWMKKLEENRYKKVYNSDARRVAWMVNNEGRTLDEMPISMKKKWSKAQYGRERYLATEFLKSKSEQLSEGLDLKKLETAIKDFQNKIKKQGRVTNARDEDHLKQLIKVYKQMGGKKIKEQMNESKLRGMIREIIKEQMDEKINLGGAYEKMLDKHNDKLAQNALSLVRNKIMKDYKVGKKSPKSSETVTRRLVATLINNGMKEIRNKAKSPSLKKAFQKIIDIREKNLKKMKEGKLKEAYRSQSIFFDKKDKSKLQKAIEIIKNKIDKIIIAAGIENPTKE